MNLEKKRLVIFGINYAPELTGIGPYTTEMAEHFAAQGHMVRVVTGVPHYPVWRRMPFRSADGTANPTVIRRQHFVPKRANAFGRMLYEFSWLLSAAPALLGGRPDVVLGIIPSLSGGILAIVAGRVWRVPVGLIVKDLMGPGAAQSGYRGGASVAGVTARIEGAVLRRADAVAVISYGFVPYLRGAGVTDDKVHRVRDWSRPGSPTQPRDISRARLGWTADEFVALHAGNMGQKQGLDTVLDAAKLVNQDRIRLVLSGDGNDRSRLEARVRNEHIRNVSFVDLQPRGQYESMLQAADVLLLNQRLSVSDMSLPSKLAAYFTSGRPVIAAVAVDSETAREVRAARGGVVVEAGNPSAMAAAITQLQASDQTAAQLGLYGKQYADAQLGAPRALAQYDEYLAALTGHEWQVEKVTAPLGGPPKDVAG